MQLVIQMTNIKMLSRLILLFLLVLLPVSASTSALEEFAGSSSCQNCHQKEYANWQQSHHAQAWLPPTAENILGNFDNQKFTHNQQQYLFDKDAQGFYITLEDAEAKQTRFKVHSAAGIAPLQQYLLETGNGKLQVPDVAWDTIEKRWFHLYPEQDIKAADGMHWTGPYKNWQARCAECHATGFEKNYDHRTQSYQSIQAETGVGCESCHGPGKAHNQNPTEHPLQQHNQTPAALLNACAACHSRREPVGANSPPNGHAFDNHYRLSLLNRDLYFADGQIKDEVYVYGSFLQSKMHAKGVTCLHCHDAHSYSLKLTGNALCTQCHNPEGNPQFSSLQQKDYDAPSHHFHQTGSNASLCVNCHMPEKHYMVIDGRRDHSFKVPRPDLSAQTAAPDVCTSCHSQQSPAWASKVIQEKLSQNRQGSNSFASTFAQARTNPGFSTSGQLQRVASDAQQSAIVRASAIDHLRFTGSIPDQQRLQQYIADSSPLVRAAIARLLRSSNDPEQKKLLLPLLKDPVASVRIDSVLSLINLQPGMIPETLQADYKQVIAELQQSLTARADFPETHLVIGGLSLGMRNIEAAIAAFEQALAMDPQLVSAWRMLARIHAATGNPQNSREVIEQGLQHNPDNPVLQATLSELH